MKKEVILLGVVLGIWGLVGRALAQTPKAAAADPAQTLARPKPAPDNLVELLEAKGILSDREGAIVSNAALQPQTKQVLAEMLLSKHLITAKEYDQTIAACSSGAAGATPAADPASGKPARSQAARHLFRWGGEEGRVPMSLSDWMASILPGGTETTTDLAFGTIQPGPPLYYPGQDQPEHARAKAKHKSHKHHGQTALGPDASAPKQ